MTDNLPVDTRELLKQQAAGLKGRIAQSTKTKLRLTKDKKFVLPDGSVTGGPLEVVIVDFISWNLFYDKAYKEDDKTYVPPACFAVGDLKNDELTPDPSVPAQQAKVCKDCVHNEWGSHPTGSGKACRNIRRLAIIAGLEPAGSDPASPMWILDVSPTSIKNFDAYVSMVKTQQDLPPVGVVTSIFFDDSVSYQKLNFGAPKPNVNAQLGINRQAEARELLTRLPDVSTYEKPAPKGGKRATKK